MFSRARADVAAAGAVPGTSSPATGRRTGLRLTNAMLLGTAALDLTRCSLVLMTSRQAASTAGLVTAGIGAAVVSMASARGYRTGKRGAAWAALVIGVASAPQASASGFRAPFTIPDAATAVLGVLLSVAVIAEYGCPSKSSDHSESPWMAPPPSQPDRNPLIRLDRILLETDHPFGNRSESRRPPPRQPRKKRECRQCRARRLT